MPKVRFGLELTGNLDDITDDLALSLYRISQECLTNAIRHGAPDHVTIRLDASKAITLSVTDDGGLREDLPESDGYGLLGIRERVAALGGSFTLAPCQDGMRASVQLSC